MAPAQEVEFRGTERFQIERRLGAGAMGVVYQALDREKGVQVALKTLRIPSAESLLRFKREFRSLQDVQHVNLVSLGELIEEAGVWFFTMELLHGVGFLEYVRPGPGGGGDEVASSRLTDVSPTAPTLRESPGQRLFDAAASVPAAPLDERRLRAALAQLVRGLSVLHSHGKVHRDVKPSNTVVTHDGRVVLLDFGLVADVERGLGFTDAGVVGTATYMAPEQALGRSVGPEADWYSVGVLLYEALVGVPPFVGWSLQVLMDKQRSEPRPPRAQVPDVPEDLNQLCTMLLRFDPAARPVGEQVLRHLGVAETPSSTRLRPLVPALGTQTPPFVGRELELAVLGQALDETRAGHQVSVFVHGESGIGKSALIRRFSEQALADERVLVLAGRCYERESVPYKAVDGLIDALARHMRRLPRHEAAVLTPLRASLLVQVFPVLRQVDALAESPRHEAIDPQELRTRVFGALRELFGRLSERHTLVVVIDDLQWADADSLWLLAELVRPPEPPPFLMLGSWREADGSTNSIRQRLESALGEVRHVGLGKLPPADACELASLLLASAGGSANAEIISREADGHPLFIDELVRYAAIRADGTAITHLEDALWSRIERLAPAPRHLLELIAVSGAPLEQAVAARAAGLAPADIDRQSALLRTVNLVRTTGTRGTDLIEPYHDRVREAVLAKLDPAARHACHRELARALEASSRVDAEALALHFREAGERQVAAKYSVMAATQASEALAFDHAAQLYRQALELHPAQHADARGLQIKLGEALENAGRGAESAAVYLAAVPGASAAEALDLQRRAAQQLLLAGRIDDGIATMRTFLELEGLHYPATLRAALLTIVRLRLQLKLRGMRSKERSESDLSPRELSRLDACDHVGQKLAFTDHIRGAAFHARSLLLALDAGEPFRLARALAQEAVFRAAAGGRHERASDLLLARSETLAKKVTNPYLTAHFLGARGQIALFSGRFRESVQRYDEAETILRERCVGMEWEKALVRLFSCRAQQYLGEYKLLARRVPELLQQFNRSSDTYAATTLRVTVAPFLHLAADDPAGAIAEVTRALVDWAPGGYHVQHYNALIGEASARLYEAQPTLAYDLVRTHWPRMKGAFMLKLQFIRGLIVDLRGRSALALATTCTGEERKRLLGEARKDAAGLAREGMPWSSALAGLLSGGIDALGGRAPAARAHLEAAVRGFEAADMALHAAAARRRLGQLLGGDQGRQLISVADAWMTEQQIANPTRLVGMLAPGS